MSKFYSTIGKRNRLAGYAMAGAISIFLPTVVAHAETNSPERSGFEIAQASTKGASEAKPAADETIRPFQFHATDEALPDLKRRVSATRWPSPELVGDDTQGVRLTTMQKLADYWANRHDWRKIEARLNALPQFVTNIDGVDIHFIHPTGLSGDEEYAWKQLDFFYKHRVGYALEMGARPQTLYGLDDSPIALAAWMIDHDPESQKLINRVFDGASEGLTRDHILDNITLYWLTNTGLSSGRLFWESKLAFFAPKGVTIPVAVSAFPDEIYTAPRSWAEKRLSEADPLQSTAQRRALCGLGTAGSLH